MNTTNKNQYISSLRIYGFKKFTNLEVSFNEGMNILIGENEAGKSTILEALRIVLHQQYRYVDKSIIGDMFNIDQVRNFSQTRSEKDLPKIRIEVDLKLNTDFLGSNRFYGENHSSETNKSEAFGICFTCEFDDTFSDEARPLIENGIVPYEYYTLLWRTYANRPYNLAARPLNTLYIDTSNSATMSSFNYYNKTLFYTAHTNEERARAKAKFRSNIETSFGELGLKKLSNDREFGIDPKRVILENVVSIFENNIALENRGAGMESLVKTQIALSDTSNINVILIEEPENHLGFIAMNQMIEEISSKVNNAQIIMTTHSSMIACRLNLKNILCISERKVLSFSKSVDEETANFFVKSDNNSILRLLLSKKVILVEGATEYLLIPYFYQKVTGKELQKDGVSLISCNGITYKYFLNVAKNLKKRIAIITDNDKDKRKIQKAEEDNEKNKQMKIEHRIFMPNNIDEYTWEVCIFNLNEEVLKKIIKVRDGAQYGPSDEKDPVLRRMLNNKVDAAFTMLKATQDSYESGPISFRTPLYVEEAIKWLNE